MLSDQSTKPIGQHTATYLHVFTEMLLQQLTDVVRHEGVVLVCCQPVIKHPQTLVPPNPYKETWGLNPLGNGLRETVVDSGEVPEIEDVVELGGSGGKVTHDTLIQLNSSCCNGF